MLHSDSPDRLVYADGEHQTYDSGLSSGADARDIGSAYFFLGLPVCARAEAAADLSAAEERGFRRTPLAMVATRGVVCLELLLFFAIGAPRTCPAVSVRTVV